MRIVSAKEEEVADWQILCSLREEKRDDVRQR